MLMRQFSVESCRLPGVNILQILAIAITVYVPRQSTSPSLMNYSKFKPYSDVVPKFNVKIILK